MKIKDRSKLWKRSKAIDSGVRSAIVAANLGEKRISIGVTNTYRKSRSTASDIVEHAKKRRIEDIEALRPWD